MGMTRMRKLSVIGIVIVIVMSDYLSVLPCQARHTIEGNWTGGLDFGEQWQRVNFSFRSEGETIKGTVDFPDQNRTGLALDQVRLHACAPGEANQLVPLRSVLSGSWKVTRTEERLI